MTAPPSPTTSISIILCEHNLILIRLFLHNDNQGFFFFTMTPICEALTESLLLSFLELGKVDATLNFILSKCRSLVKESTGEPDKNKRDGRRQRTANENDDDGMNLNNEDCHRQTNSNDDSVLISVLDLRSSTQLTMSNPPFRYLLFNDLHHSVFKNETHRSSSATTILLPLCSSPNLLVQREDDHNQQLQWHLCFRMFSRHDDICAVFDNIKNDETYNRKMNLINSKSQIQEKDNEESLQYDGNGKNPLLFMSKTTTTTTMMIDLCLELAQNMNIIPNDDTASSSIRKINSKTTGKKKNTKRKQKNDNDDDDENCIMIGDTSSSSSSNSESENEDDDDDDNDGADQSKPSSAAQQPSSKKESSNEVIHEAHLKRLKKEDDLFRQKIDPLFLRQNEISRVLFRRRRFQNGVEDGTLTRSRLGDFSDFVSTTIILKKQAETLSSQFVSIKSTRSLRGSPDSLIIERSATSSSSSLALSSSTSAGTGMMTLIFDHLEKRRARLTSSAPDRRDQTTKKNNSNKSNKATAMNSNDNNAVDRNLYSYLLEIGKGRSDMTSAIVAGLNAKSSEFNKRRSENQQRQGCLHFVEMSRMFETMLPPANTSTLNSKSSRSDKVENEDSAEQEQQQRPDEEFEDRADGASPPPNVKVFQASQRTVRVNSNSFTAKMALLYGFKSNNFETISNVSA